MMCGAKSMSMQGGKQSFSSGENDRTKRRKIDDGGETALPDARGIAVFLVRLSQSVLGDQFGG
jgi:hypothetical protein